MLMQRSATTFFSPVNHPLRFTTFLGLAVWNFAKEARVFKVVERLEPFQISKVPQHSSTLNTPYVCTIHFRLIKNELYIVHTFAGMYLGMYNSFSPNQK